MEYSKDELELMQVSCEKLNKFLIEFEVEPSIRFINGFAYCASNSLTEARNFVVNRVKLVGGNFEQASYKVKSKEFEDLYQRFKMFRLSGKKINKRLKIYFGAPGTGKTTLALKEANNNCIICNSSMLPCDLMEDFKLKDGLGNLMPSPLRSAIENGTKIVLDEFGLLTDECLRFLQGILDDKESFNYKGETIKIKEGFQVIATLNLFVNGSINPLPEAIVDRATYDGLKEFKLPSKLLVEYAFS